jgi:HAD superfamily hydrolase (TIGR01509 family)
MGYHATAWEHILNHELGAGLTPEQVKSHMYGKNEEVLQRIFGKDRFTFEEMRLLSGRKEAAYQAVYKNLMKAIPGFEAFAQRAFDQGLPMSIGSAANTGNIDFILDGLSIRRFFPVVVSADDVALSKPHPETFLKAAALMNIAPSDCLVFEDAPKGVEAARNAGMKAIVLTTTHGKEDFDGYDNVLFFAGDYLGEGFGRLLVRF